MTPLTHQSVFERHPRKTLTLILVAVILIILWGTELFLASRNTYSERETFTRHIRLREHPLNRLAFISPSDIYMKFSSTSLEQKPYRFEVDMNGFIRAESVAHFDQPDLSIAFLGGSTTECVFVDELSRFPDHIRVIMMRKGIETNVYNGGVSGNNSLHSIDILINKILPLQPDFVVMMHNINDLNLLLYEKTYWNNNPFRSLIVRESNPSPSTIAREIKNFMLPNIYQKSAEILGRLSGSGGVDEFAELRSRPVDYNAAAICSMFAQSLRSFVRTCKAWGIRPVLMTQANRFLETPDPLIEEVMKSMLNANKGGSLSYQAYRDIYLQMNEAIRAVSAAEGALLIDLAVEIPQTEEYLYDTVHFNRTGSELAARIISAALLQAR